MNPGEQRPSRTTHTHTCVAWGKLPDRNEIRMSPLVTEMTSADQREGLASRSFCVCSGRNKSWFGVFHGELGMHDTAE